LGFRLAAGRGRRLRRVIVAGGRFFYPTPAEIRAFEALWEEVSQGEPVELVHGACPTGADLWVDWWAKGRGMKPRAFPYPSGAGKAGGPIRNREMAEYSRGGALISFPGERGTADMLRAAAEYELPTHQVPCNPQRPRVLNRHHHQGKPPEPFVYIGRGTPLGNPFKVEEHGEAALDLFATHLREAVERRDPAVLEAMEAITPQHFLLCSCKPRPCHGDAVVEMWEWLAGKGEW
jgi:hypothetical protein